MKSIVVPLDRDGHSYHTESPACCGSTGDQNPVGYFNPALLRLQGFPAIDTAKTAQSP